MAEEEFKKLFGDDVEFGDKVPEAPQSDDDDEVDGKVEDKVKKPSRKRKAEVKTDFTDALELIRKQKRARKSVLSEGVVTQQADGFLASLAQSQGTVFEQLDMIKKKFRSSGTQFIRYVLKQPYFFTFLANKLDPQNMPDLAFRHRVFVFLRGLFVVEPVFYKMDAEVLRATNIGKVLKYYSVYNLESAENSRMANELVTAWSQSLVETNHRVLTEQRETGGDIDVRRERKRDAKAARDAGLRSGNGTRPDTLASKYQTKYERAKIPEKVELDFDVQPKIPEHLAKKVEAISSKPKPKARTPVMINGKPSAKIHKFSRTVTWRR